MIKAHTGNGYSISIPKSFGCYKCLKLIGYGGTSIVALVKNLKEKTKWAAKIISINDIENRKLVHSIEKEVVMLQEIEHPNIIKIREYFEIENKSKEKFIVIIMEYCEKGDLLTLTTQQKIKNEILIKKIILGFLDAIRYLHARGISHGDIKTENILLTNKNVPKLCDFGFCRTTFVAGNDSKHGTLLYAAPELFQDGQFNPFKTDIYAIGIALYSIFELKFPFKAGNEKEIVKQIKNEDLHFVFKESLKLKQLIKKCTDKNPMNRPSIEEVIDYKYFNNNENILKNNSLIHNKSIVYNFQSCN